MSKKKEMNVSLQWHPAFYAGLQIELAEEAQYLSFENEHQLGTKPKEIDVLIIKKDPNVVLKKNIGKIFRKHNIIEYKSPEDYLSIDDFYKVLGYGCFYKSDVKTVDEIKVREITISFVTKGYPTKVIRHLTKEKNLKVQKIDKGIYYVVGDYFPIQFVVTSQLSEENFWLHNLTNDLKETSEARKIIRKYTDYPNNNLYRSVVEIIVKANSELFEEASGMCEALFSLVKDDMMEKIKAEALEEFKVQLRDTFKKEVKVETLEDVKAQLIEKVKVEAFEEAKAQVKEEAKAEVKEEVKAVVKEEVKAEVKEEVKAEVEEKLKDEIREKTILSLLKDGMLTVVEAAKCLSITEEELKIRVNAV